MKFPRYLADSIKKLALDRRKMAFVSGPRQVGKTTLAKSYSSQVDACLYKNWDEITFRRLWTKSPNSLQNEFDLLNPKLHRLLILDEIHKSPKWKQRLKGLYDELGDDLQIIVTGSARLNILNKGGDSLMGRYYHFRLHPLSFGELAKFKVYSPDQWKESLFHSAEPGPQRIIERLMQLGGFPEPYFSDDEKILQIWRANRTEKIIREDLRDISHLPTLNQVEMLASILPDKVGSPLSVQSLREDLEVSFDTVKRWLKYLQELYYYFEIRPWSKSVSRSLKKEPKIYLFDWTEIENEGIRFENLVASHLLKACHFWTDTGEGKFQLFYLRNKEKNEIDFLIVKNRSPWLCIESKANDGQIDQKVAKKFQTALNIPYVQTILNPNAYRISGNQIIVSANRFLMGLP